MEVSRRVVWLPAAVDGCAFYRMWLPHLNYPGSSYAQSDPVKGMDIKLLMQFDVCVVQRQMTKQNLAALIELKKHGKKIVYDLDDHLWNIPHWNPMRKFFKAHAFADGMMPCISRCDVMTVSTPVLKRVVEGKLTKPMPVVVVENAIDLNLFAPQRRKMNRDVIVVGWAGSPTHSADIEEAMIALANVMQKDHRVHAEIMCTEIPRALSSRHSLADRVRLVPVVPVWEYPSWFMNRQWDIGLAPLIEHEFNRAKSNIKLLEVSALRIPCIASDIDTYRDFCARVPELESLLCRTRRDWVSRITELVEDKEKRQRLGELAYQVVNTEYNIKDRVSAWERVLDNA